MQKTWSQFSSTSDKSKKKPSKLKTSQNESVPLFSIPEAENEVFENQITYIVGLLAADAECETLKINGDDHSLHPSLEESSGDWESQNDACMAISSNNDAITKNPPQIQKLKLSFSM